MRRILFLITIILILLGVAYTLFNIEQQQDAHRTAYEAIPRNCALILDLKNPGEALREVRTNNQIWDEFSSSSLLSDINTLLNLADSNQKLNSLVSENRVIAYAVANDTGLTWSFIMPLPISFNAEQSIEIIESVDSLNWDHELNKGSFVVADITFHLQFIDGLLLASTNNEQIQNMLSVLESNSGLQNDANFSYAYQVGGKNKVLNLYFQHQELSSWLIKKLSPSIMPGLATFSGMGEWSELDLLLKPNSIQLNGFSVGNINLPKGDEHDLSNFTRGMPSKTAYYYSTGIVSRNLSSDQLALIDSLEQDYFPGLAKKIEQCRSYNGFVFANRSSNDSLAEAFVIFNKSNTVIDEVLKAFNSFDTSVSYPALISSTLGLPFQDSGLYHMSLENFHLFAEDAESAKRYLELPKSLNENKNFRSFKENLLSQSNFSIYMSPYRMSEEFASLFKGQYQSLWEAQSKYIEQFEGLSWQLTKESNDRVFHHFYLKYNADYQEDQNYLWTVKGDASFRNEIYLFKNHYTEADEVLVQDVNNRLHLYNNKGKKLWETKLDAPINSEVFIVDRYKNDKYQILLSTEKSIYLIDRKGRNTEGFPLEFESGLSCGIACLDYENNKNYRILAALNDGNLYNYDIDGKAVKGWNYSLREALIQTPKYFEVSSKDHILCLTENGSLLTVNRRGEKRNEIAKDLKLDAKSNFDVFAGSSESKTLILLNNNASLVQYRLDGKQKKIVDISATSSVRYTDLDADKYPEVIVQSADSIAAYEFAGEMLFKLKDSSMMSNSLSIISPEVYAIGGEDSNFKFYKSSNLQETELRVPAGKSLLKDINNDKSPEIMFVNKDGKLYCLRFEIGD